MRRVSFRDIYNFTIKRLIDKRTVHYTEVASELGIAPSTAYGYLKIIQRKHPENLQYNRGALILIKDFSEDEIPIELKYEGQKKTINTLKKALRERDKLLKKITNNHLSEMERAIAERDLRKITEIIQKIRSEVGESGSNNV